MSLRKHVIFSLPLAIAMAACSASDSRQGLESAASGEGARNAPSEIGGVVDAVQDLRAYCPKAVMRAGTETLDIYPDRMKKDDPERGAKLRFRATVTDLVRECNYAGAFLKMRVGIAGRALSGPSGETGSFTMPIRVAVTRGEELLYSKLHDVPVEIPPNRTNTKFAFVDGDIVIPKPESENIIIYVGYDEQRVDSPASRRERKPIN